MHFSLPCIDFCVIVKCSVDTKVLMAGRKKKDIACIKLPQLSDKSLMMYSAFTCILRTFTKIHQNSRINYFYLSKNDLERLLCCKQNKKCIQKQDFKYLCLYHFI